MELKTAATPLSDRDVLKYERKLLKFWIQSFLLGVPRIIVGFRSKDGILQSLEELETSQIPRLVKQRGKGTWDGNLCITFTENLLECQCSTSLFFSRWVFLVGTFSGMQWYADDIEGLKSTIVGGGVWRIRKREKATVIEVFRIEESEQGNILSHDFFTWRSKSGQGHS